MSQYQPSNPNQAFRRDGHVGMDGGVNSGISPTLIAANQAAFAVNTTFRDSFPQNRPPFRKIPLDLSNCDDFTAGKFQGAYVFDPDTGTGFHVISVNGNIYKVTVDGVAQNVTPTNDPNPSVLGQAFMEQAERWLVIQDGQSKAMIFDGAECRRADPTVPEVPTGTVMVYGLNRLWVAQGRQYVVGDLCGDPSGTAQEGFRDAVLKFTSNDFLNEGGAFTLPVNGGAITAMSVTAAPNTALGQSNVLVSNSRVICSTSVPTDRTTWKSTRNPLQTIVQKKFGVRGANQIAEFNGDSWYRRTDGYGSLIFAVRNFESGWGNRPRSREMNRVLKKDQQSLLKYGSIVNFDNRMLATVSPFLTANGVAHRGIAALDFNGVSAMLLSQRFGYLDNTENQNPLPDWDGVWTGVNVLQLVEGDFDDEPRCFAWVSNNGVIELWEIMREGDFDSADGVTDTPIEWWYETKSMSSGDLFGYKALYAAEMTYDQLKGTVNFTVKYRPDLYPFWVTWATFSECVTYKDCPPPCNPQTYQPQYRPKRGLPEPPDDFTPIIGRPLKNGYEHQIRIEVSGPARIKQFRIASTDVPEDIRGDLPGSIPCGAFTGCSDENLFSYSSE
jgi:hypothetical protein